MITDHHLPAIVIHCIRDACIFSLSTLRAEIDFGYMPKVIAA
jgi:hypothetical protein